MKLHRNLTFLLWWWITTPFVRLLVIISSSTTYGLEVPPKEDVAGAAEQPLTTSKTTDVKDVKLQGLDGPQGKDAIVDAGNAGAAAAVEKKTDTVEKPTTITDGANAAVDGKAKAVTAAGAVGADVVIPALAGGGAQKADENDDGDDELELDEEQLAAQKRMAELPEYFYADDKDSVVIENKAPKTAGVEYPADFLYRPNPHEIRIVEFYAHWCPHCQALRPYFNKFAKKMKDIAKESNLDLNVYAVSCVPFRPVCKQFRISGYPRVYVFVEGSRTGIEIPHGKVHPFQVLRAIGIQVDSDVEQESLDMEHEQNQLGLVKQQQPQDGEFWIARKKSEIYSDAYLSFDFTMRQGIFVGEGALSKTAETAFEDFLVLLQAVLPPTWKLQSMISDIIDNFEDVVESEEALLSIVDEYPPPKLTWSPSCTRGNPSAGYTCGLWQLFHIMSVGVVQWNLNNIAGSMKTFYPTEKAAKILRAFIEQFFGCEVCRVNFLHGFDTCAFNRCERLISEVGKKEDWIEFPMWLYEFHNGVNARLCRERAEREGRTVIDTEAEAVQWPSRTHCPLCWHADGRFDPEYIYAFLELIYWPEGLISSELANEILHGDSRKMNAQEEEDEEESEGLPSWAYSLTGFVFFSGVLSAASWVQKRKEIKRTGKHKKEDDSAV